MASPRMNAGKPAAAAPAGSDRKIGDGVRLRRPAGEVSRGDGAPDAVGEGRRRAHGRAAAPAPPGAAAPSGAAVRDRVTRALAIRILSGRYPQGTILPTEAELGVDLGVSRTALREATRTLAAKGLIESRQRAGTRVKASEEWNRLDADILSWMGDVEPDLDFVRGLTEARRIIEPAAAELAALRATARSVAAIEDAYEAMRAADIADLDACADADVRFHLAIMKAGRNPVLAHLGNLIAAALLSAFRLTTSASLSYARTLDAHGGVLEAIRLRRGRDARIRMQALLDLATADLLRLSTRGRQERPAGGQAIVRRAGRQAAPPAAAGSA